MFSNQDFTNRKRCVTDGFNQAFHKPEYTERLQQAHRMLAELGIPVAPLKQITVYVDGNARKNTIAECVETEDGFLILLHKNYLKIPETEMENPTVMNSLLHELLHTCRNKENGKYGLFHHGMQFLRYAAQVKKAYGYNVLTSIQKTELELSHLPPQHTLTCPCCGAQAFYYTEKSWKKIQGALEHGAHLRCSYCAGELEIWKTTAVSTLKDT